jgi:hypothetical protein
MEDLYVLLEIQYNGQRYNCYALKVILQTRQS